MKKIFYLSLVIFALQASVFAVNFGTYKTETEYGLIDGFKWNFFNREKDQPFVQLKSETAEEQARLEKEKNKPKQKMSDYEEVQMYKFMLEDTVVY